MIFLLRSNKILEVTTKTGSVDVLLTQKKSKFLELVSKYK